MSKLKKKKSPSLKKSEQATPLSIDRETQVEEEKKECWDEFIKQLENFLPTIGSLKKGKPKFYQSIRNNPEDLSRKTMDGKALIDNIMKIFSTKQNPIQEPNRDHLYNYVQRDGTMDVAAHQKLWDILDEWLCPKFDTNDPLTLKVTGKALNLRQIKKHMTDDCEEVHICASGIIYVDCDWNFPGKNMALSAPRIDTLTKTRSLNTSGRSASPLPVRRAEDVERVGESEDHGRNGDPGGDAGDVYIKTERLIGKLYIDASGGNGADGDKGNKLWGFLKRNFRRRSPRLANKDEGTPGSDGGLGGKGGQGGKVTLKVSFGLDTCTYKNCAGKQGKNGHQPGSGGKGGSTKDEQNGQSDSTTTDVHSTNPAGSKKKKPLSPTSVDHLWDADDSNETVSIRQNGGAISPWSVEWEMYTDGDETKHRKIIATAEIRFQNIESGTTPNDNARKFVQDRINKKANRPGGKKFEAGHIIPNRMGGTGRQLENIFPVDATLNKGKLSNYESQVFNYLESIWKMRKDANDKWVRDSEEPPEFVLKYTYYFTYGDNNTAVPTSFQIETNIPADGLISKPFENRPPDNKRPPSAQREKATNRAVHQPDVQQSTSSAQLPRGLPSRESPELLPEGYTEILASRQSSWPSWRNHFYKNWCKRPDGHVLALCKTCQEYRAGSWASFSNFLEHLRRKHAEEWDNFDN